MKKIKKALIGITSLVMAFSMTALTACSETNTPGGSKPGEIQNPGNTGDPNNPGNPGNPNEPGTTETKSDAKKVLDAFQKQSFKGISLEYTLDSKNKSTEYESDEKGEKLPEAVEEVSWRHTVGSMKAKVNASTMEVDTEDNYLAEQLNEDGSAVDETVPAQVNYNYSFVRGGKLFYASADEEIEDISKATLSYDSTFAFPEELQALLAMLPEDGITGDLLAPVTTLIGLADEYGGAAFADSKLTVNLNKVVYGLYSEAVKEIENLDEETTVGELFASKPVKALIQSLTYGMDATEVHELIIQTLTEMLIPGDGEATEEYIKQQQETLETIKKGITAPADGDDIYTYLLKNLQSKEFSAMIIYVVTGENLGSLIAPFADMKFADIMTLVGMVGGSGNQQPDGTEQGGVSAQAEEGGALTLDDIKDMLKGYLEYVTVTEDTFTLNIDSSTAISQAELIFAVNGNYEITSVSVSAEITTNFKYGVGDHDSQYVCEEYTASKLQATVELATEELTLTDISKNTVEYTQYGMNDGVYYDETVLATVDIVKEDGKSERTEIYAGVEIEGGKFKAVRLYTTQDGDGYTEIEGSASVDDTVTLNYGDYIKGTQYRVFINEYANSIGVRLFKTEEGELMWNIENYPYVMCDSQASDTFFYVEESATPVTTTVEELLK